MSSIDKYYDLMDKFIADMNKQRNNAKMKAFTKDIGEMLKKNGVVPYLIECESMSATDTSVTTEFGYVLEKLDFTEHDKVFKDKIAKLENELEEWKEEARVIKKKRDEQLESFRKGIEPYADLLHMHETIAELKKDYKTASELLGKYQRENESLKKRIIELENFSCQAWQETESLVEKLKQRIAELESKETETCEKEPISDDCGPSMEWYENRHQSDCIEINRLNTTIDVLIHKVEYLRQFAGLE